MGVLGLHLILTQISWRVDIKGTYQNPEFSLKIIPQNQPFALTRQQPDSLSSNTQATKPLRKVLNWAIRQLDAHLSDNP